MALESSASNGILLVSNDRYSVLNRLVTPCSVLVKYTSSPAPGVHPFM